MSYLFLFYIEISYNYKHSYKTIYVNEQKKQYRKIITQNMSMNRKDNIEK